MATKVGKQHGAALAQPGNTSQASNPLISDAKLRQIFETMLQCRVLGQRLRSMRRSEPWGKYSLSPVEELVAVGAAIDLRRKDWVTLPRGAVIAGFLKGVPLNAILSQSNAGSPRRKTGSNKGRSMPIGHEYSGLHMIPPSPVPVAQLNLAAGVALAMHAQKNGNIVLAFIDGPISGPPFHDALHFAGLHCLPLVVVVQIEASAKLASINRKIRPANLLAEAHACGFPVIPVDAHDVVAIYRVAHESIHKARHGGGPTLIEATAFRAPASRGAANARSKLPDAIGKMEDYLITKGLFSPGWKQKALDRFDRNVEAAIDSAQRAPSTKRV